MKGCSLRSLVVFFIVLAAGLSASACTSSPTPRLRSRPSRHRHRASSGSTGQFDAMVTFAQLRSEVTSTASCGRSEHDLLPIDPTASLPSWGPERR
jgi:hypothetical protein